MKLQWKPDFGARWAAFSVDFEMFGKDHGPKHGRLMNGSAMHWERRAPEHFVLRGCSWTRNETEDNQVERQRVMTIDEWLSYAPTECLALYMFQRPARQKLYFERHSRASTNILPVPRPAYPKRGLKERSGITLSAIHSVNPLPFEPAGVVCAAAHLCHALQRA